jgi:cyclopropane fatty-acyl-phospholipid synthase-like methyltransferase
MKEMWNERYSSNEYAYGTDPNVFFKTSIEKHKIKGRILLPAEGEGRNAVYAAQQGLDVTAFDISEEGKKKALRLGELQNVNFKNEIGDFLKMDFAENWFDAAAIIHAHFPPNISSVYHKKVSNLIKPNGKFILEGFSKNNLHLREKNPKIGGPNKIDMLYSEEEIMKDFSDFEVLQLEELEIELNEGKYHKGIAKMIRFIGKKKD